MKKILFLMLLTMFGCVSKVEKQQSQSRYNSDVLELQIKYYKDTTTNLCYAGMYVGSNANSITSVPCTTKVEEVAIPFQSGKFN